MSLQALIQLVLKVSIVLMVLAFGLNATFSEATCMFRKPRELGRAFVSMNVFMPVLALLLVFMFRLHPAVKIALVALSVSPVPPFFPKKGEKAGGMDEYAVGLTVATSLLAIVVIPVTMEIFERIVNVPLSMPIHSVALLVLSTVLLPLGVGIAIRAMMPELAKRAARPVGIVATVLLVSSMLPVLLVSMRAIVSLVGDGTLLSFMAFALIGYGFGHYMGGPEIEKRRVLALATSSRHPAIALAIARTNFPQQKLAIPAVLLYVIVSALVTSLPSNHDKAGRTQTETEKRLAA